MAVDDKYVMNGVWLTCDKGVTPSRFNVTPKPVQLYDEHFANELDKIALVNILPFGACSVKYGSPCVPMPLVWNNVMDEGLTVLGARPLLDTSKCQCGIGGQISIHFTKTGASAAAQSNQLDHVDEAADKMETASTWAFWGGVGLAVGGAILCATGVGAPLGAAMIVGAEVAIEASTVMASAAAVIKGVTKFTRNPTLENGLSIVGETVVNLAEQYVLNKLGGAAVKKLGKWGTQVSKKLNLSERAKSIAHRIRCFFTGHPVDVISGYLYTEAVDFEFPGPIPLRWERLWYSTSIHAGALGHGWHHAYDLALVVEEAEGFAGLRGADGRGIAFDVPAFGARAFNRLEKMSLLRDERGYGVLDHEQGLTYRFGPAGPDDVRVLVAAENANGFAITFAYDERGHLAQIVDSAKREFTVQCDEAGRILTISTAHPTEPRQRVTLVRYAYSEWGELVRATDALDQAATYQYREKLLVQETFKNGLSFYFEYVGQGPEARCTRTWGDEGIYDHKLVYDLDARRTVVTNSLGHVTTYLGNENGLVIEIQDARGGVTLTEYNELNEKLHETNSLGFTTSYQYDERGHCRMTTLPSGAAVRRNFDEQDRLVSLIDAVGGRWQWAYTSTDDVVVRTNPLGGKAHFQFAEGTLQRFTDESRRVVEYLYDASANLVEQRVDGLLIQRSLYDGWGQIRKLSDARGNVAWRNYDLLGRLTILHEADGNVRRFVYDGFNNITRVTDRLRDVQYAYRGLGRLIRRAEAGVFIEFLHDAEEQLLGILNEQGLLYRFERDAVGNTITEIGFDGLTRRYQRDACGQVSELVLPTGQRTLYRYNADGRVVAIDYADGTTQRYTYRADGALLEAMLNESRVSIVYDLLGNRLKEQQGEHTITYAYDNAGQQIQLASSLGADIHHSRNQSGRVERMKAGNWQALFTYDAQGLEIQRTLASGVHTRWQRDQLGRLVEQRTRTLFGHQERLKRYEWQVNDQLAQVQDSEYGTTTFTYDAIGNLATTTFGDAILEGRWPDTVGNLFRTQARLDTQYSAGGRLLASQNGHYTYDQAGNLSTRITTNKQEWQYQWNAQGHLTEVIRPDGTIVSFQYDALGRRIAKTHRGTTTHWLWDGNNPLHEWTTQKEEADSASQVITWLFQDNSYVPMARLQGENFCDIITDQLGTPFALRGNKGQPLWDAEITSYGQLRYSKGDPALCPFRYQGQYEDAETGLYYNGLRYFSPTDGIYISQDPIGLRGGMKPYAYVGNPNFWVDPLGLANFPTNVDFTGHPDLFPIDPSKGHVNNIVTIKMTGDRGSDFTEAYKQARIKRVDATDYTWHHVHDLNPATGESTMQLVKTTTHEAYLPHKGSVSQYEAHFGLPSQSYGTYDAKMKSYNAGWRTKKPKLKCPVTP
jgi:RHS repeat-associated protein